MHYGHSRYNPRGPDSNWCIKDAGGGRPISDDVIVRCNSRDAYDLIGGAGANGYSWHVDPIGPERFPAAALLTAITEAADGFSREAGCSDAFCLLCF